MTAAMTVLDHPIIADRLARLRDKDCSSQHFRLLVGNVARLMVPQVTSDLAAEPCEVETPLELMKGARLARQIVLVPILRAGLSLSDGFLDLIPEAVVVHLGLARNEKTLEPETYYQNVKFDFTEAHVLVLDPMLATGGSAKAANRVLVDAGVSPSNILFANLVCCQAGITAVHAEFPEVTIVTSAIDPVLNEQMCVSRPLSVTHTHTRILYPPCDLCVCTRRYIVPGLGDFGDRYFGT